MIVLFLIGISMCMFYWYSIRPHQIMERCDMEVRQDPVNVHFKTCIYKYGIRNWPAAYGPWDDIKRLFQ